jgi:hypothetical protein
MPSGQLNDVLMCTNAATGKVEWKSLGQAVLPQSAYFNDVTAGQANIQNLYATSTLYFTPMAGVNKVLGCVDSTGYSTWRAIENSMLPQNVVNESLTSYNVVTNYLQVTNTLNVSGNFLTKPITSPTFNMIENINVTSFSYGTTIDVINPAITHFNPEVTYFIWNTNPVECGTFTVPMDYSSILQFQIPLYIEHQWAFSEDIQYDDYHDNPLIVNYRVEKVTFFIQDVTNPSSPYLYTVDSIQNSSFNNTDDLGRFSFRFERSRAGPNTDEVTMRTNFAINNSSYQFSPPRRNFQAVYSIYVQYTWSYYYYGSPSPLRNYWGHNPATNSFPHFTRIVLNQTFDTTFYYESKYQNDPFYPNAHRNSYYDVFWSHNGLSSTSFVWGSYTTRQGCIGYIIGDAPEAWGNQQLRANIINTESLYIGSEGIVSLGLTNTRGYMGRKGIGIQKTRNNITASEIESTRSITFNHWFNWWWTGGKIRTYVDTTWILDQTPNVSDYRIKKNFRLIPDVLPSLCATTVWSFDVDYDDIYKVTNKVGVIAHELAENCPFAPNLVDGKKDAVDSEGKILPQRLEYQELTILLLKAVQELKEENDRLKIQIEELFKLVHSQTPP